MRVQPHFCRNAKRFLMVSVLWMACAAFAQPISTAIENETLSVRYISPGGYFQLFSKSSNRTFVSYGAFDHGMGVATTKHVGDWIFGEGKAIEVVYPDGSKDSMTLFPHLPFALFSST